MKIPLSNAFSLRIVNELTPRFIELTEWADFTGLSDLNRHDGPDNLPDLTDPT